MPNLQWIKAHETCAGCVCRDGIVGEHDLPKLAGISLQWSISFHSDYSISYYEVNRNCGADVENALVNAAPVEEVLWPAVLHARHDTKHIFQT
jgi:hypothetical protein